MIGGRNGWIAWPAGLACAGVVAALAWLAIPGVPAAVQFVGQTLRTGSLTAQAAPTAMPAVVGQECRSLYPDGLWMQLSWRGDTVLDQTAAPPTTVAAPVRDALAPTAPLTCVWRMREVGAVTTTLATVDAAAAPVAQAGFAAAGFTCADAGTGIRCERTAAGGTEIDIIRDGRWLSVTEQGWHPTGYVELLAAHLWP